MKNQTEFDATPRMNACIAVNPDNQVNTGPVDKYSYYYKNFIVYSFAVVLHFAAVYPSANLLTTFAGSALGFTALATGTLVGFLAVFFMPGLIQSFGTQRLLLAAHFNLSLFVASQFHISYYTIIPGAICYGIGIATFWISAATYVNKVAVSYADICGMEHEQVISFANGVLMACYTAGVLIGNALSSSILLPSGLDDQSVAIGNDSCNLMQSTDHIDPYNAYLMVLRGILLASTLSAFFCVLLFVDKIKEEDTTVFNFKFIILKLKCGIVELIIKLWKRPYILLGAPIVITHAFVQAFMYGSFPKEYISECVGVHIVGYAAMAYALSATVAAFLTGKVYLVLVPRYVVAITCTVMHLSLVTFLIIWKKEPSYPFIFVFSSLWGITDGKWNTLASSFTGHMFHEDLELAYTFYIILVMFGYFISFGTGVALDIQGIQYLIVGILLVSLPLYLMAEWIHKRTKPVVDKQLEVPTLHLMDTASAVTMEQVGKAVNPVIIFYETTIW